MHLVSAIVCENLFITYLGLYVIILRCLDKWYCTADISLNTQPKVSFGSVANHVFENDWHDLAKNDQCTN